jgi:putative transposase
MARLPRLVLPGIPHHVTQRGNRRQRTFFEDGDYALYLDLLAGAAARHGVEIWPGYGDRCVNPGYGDRCVNPQIPVVGASASRRHIRFRPFSPTAAGSPMLVSRMARLPRLVLPGIPHHVTQRGNRRERTFFERLR